MLLCATCTTCDLLACTACSILKRAYGCFCATSDSALYDAE